MTEQFRKELRVYSIGKCTRSGVITLKAQHSWCL